MPFTTSQVRLLVKKKPKKINPLKNNKKNCRKTCKISSDTASVSSSEPSIQTEDQLGNQAEENSSDSEEVEVNLIAFTFA